MPFGVECPAIFRVVMPLEARRNLAGLSDIDLALHVKQNMDQMAVVRVRGIGSPSWTLLELCVLHRHPKSR